MTIPTYDQFIDPILRFLAANPDGTSAKEGHEAAADALHLSEDERSLLLPSGKQRIYKNRAGWAHDRLKRAGLSSSPKRGYWKLTDEGVQYAANKSFPLSQSEVEHIATEFMDVSLRGEDATTQRSTDLVTTSTESPDERLESAVIEIKTSIANELLEMLRGVSPEYFETIVLDVLHGMGYGAKRTDLQRVGKSGDEGIDGIISLDKLGLEKVYVQAKRWQSNIGGPELQAFYGALAGQHASKGVFITTSSYTPAALKFASTVQGIVLIDGRYLAEIMIDHDVGVTSTVIRLPSIDTDYFDE